MAVDVAVAVDVDVDVDVEVDVEVDWCRRVSRDLRLGRRVLGRVECEQRRQTLGAGVAATLRNE